MSNLILKKDCLKFKELAQRILPRKGTGCLAFTTCDRGELQAEILEGLKKLLEADFCVREHVIRQNQPYLGVLPVYDPLSPDLHVYTGYPYDRLIAGDPKLAEDNRKLAATLNIERDLLPRHNLHVIFILPQHVENTIALLAPDFYHFRTYSIHFQADLLSPLPRPRKLDLVTLERGRFLEKQLYHSRDWIHKANTHLELAKWNMSASEMKIAKQHLDKAVKFYQKKKFEAGLVEAYREITNMFVKQKLFRQAEIYSSRILNLLGVRNDLFFASCLYHALIKIYQCSPCEARVWIQNVSDSSVFDEVGMLRYNIVKSMLDILVGEPGGCIDWLKSLQPSQSISKAKGSVVTVGALVLKCFGEFVEVAEGDSGSIYVKLKMVYMGEWAVLINQLLVEESEDSETKELLAMILYNKREFVPAEIVALQAQERLSKQENEFFNRYVKTLLLKIERHTKPAEEVEAECLTCLANWQHFPAHECVMLQVVLGFIYCDTDRPAMAWEMVQQATTVAEHAGYRFLEAELAMLSARLLGKEGKWSEAYDKLKHGYERVRDRHVAMEAELLELLGQAAEQCGNPRAKGWYHKALALYEMLEHKQAAVVAAALERLASGEPDQDRSRLPS